MQTFTPGKYLGENTQQVAFDGLFITRSSYTEAFSSGWHQHENAYLALVLKGGSIERRQHAAIECTPGMLLLYPSHEIHRNLHYQNNSKNLNVEFTASWLKKFGLDENGFGDHFRLHNPTLTCGLLRAMREMEAPDSQTAINLESALLAALTPLKYTYATANKPVWINQLHALLHDATNTNHSLHDLALLVDVHPVTISRQFPKHTGVNIGDYIRMIKIERSLSLLSRKSIPMEEIAAKSGFTDNAHFTRIFKKHTGITPSCYRALL